MGKEKVLIIGYLLFVVSTALMLLISANAFYTYMMAAIFGLYIGISETFQCAIVPRYVIFELRGAVYGLYIMS
jgi:Na+/melibiose symporter-like transporter